MKRLKGGSMYRNYYGSKRLEPTNHYVQLEQIRAPEGPNQNQYSTYQELQSIRDQNNDNDDYWSQFVNVNY